MDSKLKPVRKVAYATAIGIPAGTIVAWLVTLTGVEVPPPVATAFGGFIVGVVAWLTKSEV